LHTRQADCSPLHLAAYNGHPACVELLLEAKADVTKMDNVRNQPSRRRARMHARATHGCFAEHDAPRSAA
jgi:ankyrin repeat protein